MSDEYLQHCVRVIHQHHPELPDIEAVAAIAVLYYRTTGREVSGAAALVKWHEYKRTYQPKVTRDHENN